MSDAGRPVVVLLEGGSDVAAIRTLLAARGVHSGVELRDMGGATNIGRCLAEVVADGSARRVVGMCDSNELRFFAAALAGNGAPVTGADDMAEFGFHVCESDLEDELIRALGPRAVLDVLDELGLTRSFGQFCRQPSWRGRPVEAQLRRFAGVASGRKAAFAQALAEALGRTAPPVPMRRLIGQVAAALEEPPGPPLARFLEQTAHVAS